MFANRYIGRSFLCLHVVSCRRVWIAGLPELQSSGNPYSRQTERGDGRRLESVTACEAPCRPSYHTGGSRVGLVNSVVMLKCRYRNFLLATVAALVPLWSGAQTPDWKAIDREAETTLVELIQLDTSQPAGNEILAARYLQGKLEQEGIPSRIFESAPGRASIVARVKGNGSKRPLLLLGHLDVVAVEPEQWSSDPFAGIMKDGKIFGRGAADDKGVVAGAFQILLELHRLKIPLDRDVIFLGVADEEGGGALGITYMVEKHRSAIDAEFAINEGGGGQIDPVTGKYTAFNIGTAEKTPRRARLIAHGRAGHGSVPTKDNPVGVLARAVARLFDHALPVRLNATTRMYFQRLAESAAKKEDAEVYRAILEPNPSDEVQDRLRSLNRRYYSMIRTSVVPTIIQGGYQRNVIPAEAEATLDIRALPDEDPEKLFSTLKRVMAEPGVDLIPLQVTRPAHPPAPLDGELFKTFDKVLGEAYPGALVLPSMGTGASDSAQLRAAGIPAYGFGPGRETGRSSGVHGNDEYLLLKAYHDYLRLLWQVVMEVAATKVR